MPVQHHKGRGALSGRDGRFTTRPVEFDPAEDHERAQQTPQTILKAMQSRRIISSNTSPDVPFDRSINPYQGCEHGCIYCYARPSHSYLGLSPGLDFETRIFYKPDAAKLLLEEWEKPGYDCKPITIGANTDPYQPAEKSTRITRALIELFARYEHPLNIITKANLIERDIDLLAGMASRGLCSVAISLPTMNRSLKRIMEPRVPSHEARLKAMARLAANGIPTSVLFAPLIPAINDNETEQVLEAAAAAGASQATYIFLRLPHEVRDLFVEWLETHYPERAKHVMSLVRQASGGRDYDHRFGIRQTGRGAYADMLALRFRKACKQFGLNVDRYQHRLDCSRFRHPGRRQLDLDL